MCLVEVQVPFDPKVLWDDSEALNDRTTQGDGKLEPLAIAHSRT